MNLMMQKTSKTPPTVRESPRLSQLIIQTHQMVLALHKMQKAAVRKEKQTKLPIKMQKALVKKEHRVWGHSVQVFSTWRAAVELAKSNLQRRELLTSKSLKKGGILYLESKELYDIMVSG